MGAGCPRISLSTDSRTPPTSSSIRPSVSASGSRLVFTFAILTCHPASREGARFGNKPAEPIDAGPRRGAFRVASAGDGGRRHGHGCVEQGELLGEVTPQLAEVLALQLAKRGDPRLEGGLLLGEPGQRRGALPVELGGLPLLGAGQLVRDLLGPGATGLQDRVGLGLCRGDQRFGLLLGVRNELVGGAGSQ